MKRRIMYCDYCNEDTIHLVFKRVSVHRGQMRINREVKHCTKCNRRIIRNSKSGKTYVK